MKSISFPKGRPREESLNQELLAVGQRLLADQFQAGPELDAASFEDRTPEQALLAVSTPQATKLILSHTDRGLHLLCWKRKSKCRT